MTNSKVLPKTYATLRFAGDRLDPEHISAILPVTPKRAHRKGQVFFAGQRAGNLTGRTGIWYIDTREMRSHDLADHLRVIVTLLYPEPGNTDRVNRLREVMGREHGEAHVSCFWHGRQGARPPAIPEDIRAALAQLPADIETDYATDAPAA